MTTAESDKPFKQIEHRRERRAVKVALEKEADPPHPKEFGDPWRAMKDGKTRFDPKKYPQLMRK